MLSKLHNSHSTKSIYLKPKSDKSSLFGIAHFAGVVYYNPHGEQLLLNFVFDHSTTIDDVWCRFPGKESRHCQQRSTRINFTDHQHIPAKLVYR